MVRQHIPEARIVDKNNFSLKSLLVNSRDKLTHLNKSGIYRLTCHDCPASYVGRTIKFLQTGTQEHLCRASTSAFGRHLLEEGHSFDVSVDFKILHNQKLQQIGFHGGPGDLEGNGVQQALFEHISEPQQMLCPSSPQIYELEI